MGHAQSSATNLSLHDVVEAPAARPRVRLVDVTSRPPGFSDVYVRAEDGNTFMVDTRHFPIVVLKLPGSPTETGAKRYYEWLWDMTRYAAAQGQKLVVVNDFSKAEMPPPVVRKYMAEEAARIQSHVGFGHWVPILPNTLIRGLATALVWMSGGNDKKQAHFTGTMSEGLEKAKILCPEGGEKLVPGTYMFPA